MHEESREAVLDLRQSVVLVLQIPLELCELADLRSVNSVAIDASLLW